MIVEQYRYHISFAHMYRLSFCNDPTSTLENLGNRSKLQRNSMARCTSLLFGELCHPVGCGIGGHFVSSKWSWINDIDHILFGGFQSQLVL